MLLQQKSQESRENSDRQWRFQAMYEELVAQEEVCCRTALVTALSPNYRTALCASLPRTSPMYNAYGFVLHRWTRCSDDGSKSARKSRKR